MTDLEVKILQMLIRMMRAAATHLTATLTLAEGGADGVAGAVGVIDRALAVVTLCRSTPGGVRSPASATTSCVVAVEHIIHRTRVKHSQLFDTTCGVWLCRQESSPPARCGCTAALQMTV